jgi:hypothetical protein
MALVSDITMGTLIVLLLVVIVILVFSYNYDVKHIKQYEKIIYGLKTGQIENKKIQRYLMFKNELKNDMIKYNLDPDDNQQISKYINNIVREEIGAKESLYKIVSYSVIENILRGGIIGYITGGLSGSVAGALVFGSIVPAFTFYKGVNPPDENLF